jgi:hypothetical protein
MPRKSTAELKERLELCREFGVLSYSETDAGFSFQLGPAPLNLATFRPAEEVLTDAERAARRTKEFRRVATLHNPASRSGR